MSRNKSVWYRAAEKIASSRPGGWYFARIAPKIDRILIPATNGRFSTAGNQPVGIVHMKGAKSGLPRPTPLVCTPDGDNWVVIASNGGNKKNPAWYYNLKAHPEVTLEIFGETRGYVAREVSGDEKATCWQKATDLYAGYDAYKSRSGRDIPVFVLSPQAEEPTT